MHTFLQFILDFPRKKNVLKAGYLLFGFEPVTLRLQNRRRIYMYMYYYYYYYWAMVTIGEIGVISILHYIYNMNRALKSAINSFTPKYNN